MKVRTSITLLDDGGEPIQSGTLFRHHTQEICWAFLSVVIDLGGEAVVRLTNPALKGSGTIEICEVPLCEFLNRWQPVTHEGVHGGDRDPDHDPPAASI